MLPIASFALPLLARSKPSSRTQPTSAVLNRHAVIRDGERGSEAHLPCVFELQSVWPSTQATSKRLCKPCCETGSIPYIANAPCIITTEPISTSNNHAFFMKTSPYADAPEATIQMHFVSKIIYFDIRSRKVCHPGGCFRPHRAKEARESGFSTHQ